MPPAEDMKLPAPELKGFPGHQLTPSGGEPEPSQGLG